MRKNGNLSGVSGATVALRGAATGAEELVLGMNNSRQGRAEYGAAGVKL